MEITTKVAALLDVLSRDHIAALPPAERQRFADQLARVSRLVQAETAEPAKSGVLDHLSKGDRSQ